MSKPSDRAALSSAGLLPSRSKALAVFGSGLLLPPSLFVLFAFGRRRRARLHGDVAYRRGRVALKKAMTVRREVDRALAEERLTEAATVLSRGLREYVGDRLNVEGTALTPAETAALLTSHGVGDADAESSRALLQDCEAILFGATRPELAPRDSSLRRARASTRQVSGMRCR